MSDKEEAVNAEGEIIVPLKEKHLTYRSYQGGKYVGRTGNSNGRLKSKSLWKMIQEAAKRRGKKS